MGPQPLADEDEDLSRAREDEESAEPDLARDLESWVRAYAPLLHEPEDPWSTLAGVPLN